MLRQHLASGTIPVDQEVRMRQEAAEFLIQHYNQLQQPQFIHDAIEHLEIILRRIPQDSPDRAKYLNRLSYAKMTEHMITSVQRSLDQAVRYGRQAKEVAEATRLLDRQVSVYFEILSNYGFALSHRYALLQQMEDLNDAIACARTIVDSAPKDSEPYEITLNNLASRLRMRYGRSGHSKDIDEAIALVQKSLSLSAKGTVPYGVALGQLGMITADKFKRTQSLQDLQDAISHCTEAVKALPPTVETRVDLFRQIIQLYDQRYRITKDTADLTELANYSGSLFKAIPGGHAARGQFLLDHCLHLQNHLFTAPTLPLEEKYVSQIQLFVSMMPQDFVEKFKCQSVMVNIFGQRYILTHKLEDLRFLADFTRTVLEEHNSKSETMNPPKPKYDTKWLQDLINNLRTCCGAAAGNPMRAALEKDVYEIFDKQYIIQHAALDAMIVLCEKRDVRLQVISLAVQAGRTLSEADIDAEVANRKAWTETEPKKAEASRYRPPEYKTELGLRKLAIDPETKHIVMDLSNMLESVLGYDPTEKVTPQEAVAREARMEKQAIQKARDQGRHPNLKLCRMCRDHTKPIQLGQGGFELTAKDSLYPFGNYFQLSQRKSICVLCRSILSIIEARLGVLHPRLAAIDREIQGTRLSSGTLRNGEKVMRIDYGMRQVGELRLVTPKTYQAALRQGWCLDPYTSFDAALNGHGSPIHDPHDQRINLEIIKAWLHICDHSHGTLCNTAKSEVRADTAIPMNFIDVSRDCLVSATSHEKYFALSYVWGRVEMSKTVKSNFEQRQQPGGLGTKHLPATIRDAVEFVAALSERYLWVDAICLVQDDQDQMQRDIPRMDIVYGRAFATIVALGGDDANAGLPGVYPGTRPPQTVEQLLVSKRSTELDDDPQDPNREVLGLVAAPRAFYLEVELSKWNSRGWILQERLLSRRCIYFSPSAVYFQCGQDTLCEGGSNEEYTSFMLGRVALDDNHVMKKSNHDNPLSDIDAVYRMRPEQRTRSAFQTYKALLETYSKREFSFKSDILNGFAGMSAVLSELLEGPTLHGLPTAVFSHALLWTPNGRLPRRGASLPTMVNFQPGKPDRNFPSWSWVGWDGPVEYRLFDEANGNIIFPKPLVRLFELEDEGDRQVIEVKGYIEKPAPGVISAPDSTDIGTTTGGPSNAMSATEEAKKQVLAKIVPDLDRNSSWVVMPPVRPAEPVSTTPPRNILRFKARTVPLTAFKVTPRKEYLSVRTHIHVRGDQAVRRIVDRSGKHCGLWWDQAGYGYVGMGMSAEAEGQMVMAAISEYENIYWRRKGPNRVEGEIRMFDDDVYPATGAGSGIVNVLVVDQDMGHPDKIGDRCTVAVIHQKAWEEAGPQEAEIQVA
ncbi:uncharacterized protein E0L32_003443 [Thyridium curvatum]|uniref:Heterokaryon incompatibility domain-containing protein n=1 Tax=Thyridium curvatum TaxID=1093900 RepID=A0A507BIP2_9PEZI|nr:uncharacterized protein E0L32_003443 [Thyridium curvatum]TPX16881.1 hypothetical protein E0L32_003443 [Thyridium curvatum]